MQLNPSPGVLRDDRPWQVARPIAMLLGATMLALLLLYLGTARSIVAIWNSSETFAHGYVILPIAIWLIWRKRDNFSLYPVQPYPPALAVLAILGLGWLAAQLGEVQVVSQYTFVAMLPVAALALLGPRLAGSLAFPLLFLLFAVPFGDIFVAPLIQFTADFTVWAVRATGIPVLRNGTRFELPTGSWSVVEACSGVRYLISSITLGCLYAYLTYRSNRRRLLFIGLSIVVPIIANGLRAYMIVMIGHLSSMQLATGVDHIIYGWLFFGLVMFVMFWIGGFWREDTDTPAHVRAAAAATGTAAAPATAALPRRVTVMAGTVLAVCALAPIIAFFGERANHNPRPVDLPAIAIGLPQTADFASWTPDYYTPDVTFHRVYQTASAPVGLTVLYYRNQNRDKSLINSQNRLAGYEDPWHEIDGTTRQVSVAGQPVSLHEAIMNGPQGKIMVWSFNWVGAHYTNSGIVGKLRQAASKAMLRGDDGAAILLSAPAADPARAEAALRGFVAAHGGAIDAALTAARTR